MSTSNRLVNQITVTSGPTDDELKDAWRYAFDRRHPDFRLEFTGYWDHDHMRTLLPFTAQITGLDYNSGERGDLLVKANFVIGTGGGGKPWKVKGEYSSITRKGHFDSVYTEAEYAAADADDSES